MDVGYTLSIECTKCYTVGAIAAWVVFLSCVGQGLLIQWISVSDVVLMEDSILMMSI
jgi:hypothetical protein